MIPYLRYINKIARCTTRYRGEQLKEYGLKGCHFVYLIHVCANPGLSQDEISKNIYINKSNVARQLAFLEEQGFVYRLPREEDKRVTEVFPTKKTLDMYPRLREILREWADFVFSDFTQDELDIFGRLVIKASERAAEKVESVYSAGEE